MELVNKVKVGVPEVPFPPLPPLSPSPSTLPCPSLPGHSLSHAGLKRGEQAASTRVDGTESTSLCTPSVGRCRRRPSKAIWAGLGNQVLFRLAAASHEKAGHEQQQAKGDGEQRWAE